MELCRIRGEFETEDMAELAAARIRRSVRGIRRMTLRRIGQGARRADGRKHFTMLPANLRMLNYATDVMISDMSDQVLPEYRYSRTCELTVLCSREAVREATGLMQALGAVNVT
ncbi:MAG: hypothetical protein IJ055_06130 [Oscillospiraceae bacterium]|nr:hypothetical protein [Oscillospiraceae bacterium]